MRNAVARGEEQYELQMRGADDGQIRAEHVADLWQNLKLHSIFQI